MHAKEFLGTKKTRISAMRVLYIGNYRDGTGWAQAAMDNILSMDSVGIDVVPRPIKLNSNQVALPERLLALEEKDSSNCDICIQHVLPHMLDYNGRFKKNIALYDTETDNFKWSIWPERINGMDEAWVINNQMAQSSKDSGVTIPIKVVPHASNVAKFKQRYEPLQLPNADGNFIFYFVGEFIRRKNLAAFIKAFHSEFETNEPVSIVIKTNKYGLSPNDCAKEVQNMSDNIKKGMKLYPELEDYKEDLIITDRLSDENLLRLHAACDCFVMPSYGEAWCIPAFDAMGFGNTPICTDVGGMADYLNDGEGVLVTSRKEPVFGMIETFNDLFTARENWNSIDLLELRKSMRNIYQLHSSDPKGVYKTMQDKGKKRVEEYSYKAIGNLIKTELEK